MKKAGVAITAFLIMFCTVISVSAAPVPPRSIMPMAVKSPPPPPVSGGSEYNFDRPGMDFRSIDYSEATLVEMCKSACSSDANCKSYSFVRPGFQGPSAKCYLKSGVPNPVNNSCCVSGLKSVASVSVPPPPPPPPGHQAVPAGGSCDPNTMKLFLSNGEERCFGALGNACESQGTPLLSVPGVAGTYSSGIPGLPVVKPDNQCKMRVAVSVGSIIHDNCCKDYPNGLYCKGGVNLYTAFTQDLPAQFMNYDCAREWRKAFYDVQEGRYWYETFGPYTNNDKGDNLQIVRPPRPTKTFGQLGVQDRPMDYTLNERVETRRLKAPRGTKLEFSDAAYCESGRFSTEGWCSGIGPARVCSDSAKRSDPKSNKTYEDFVYNNRVAHWGICQ